MLFIPISGTLRVVRPGSRLRPHLQVSIKPDEGTCDNRGRDTLSRILSLLLWTGGGHAQRRRPKILCKHGSKRTIHYASTARPVLAGISSMKRACSVRLYTYDDLIELTLLSAREASFRAHRHLRRTHNLSNTICHMMYVMIEIRPINAAEWSS